MNQVGATLCNSKISGVTFPDQDPENPDKREKHSEGMKCRPMKECGILEAEEMHMKFREEDGIHKSVNTCSLCPFYALVM